MGEMKSKHIVWNFKVEKILRDTPYEKYVSNLKLNGIFDLRDIFDKREDNTLPSILEKSIENKDDRLGVMLLFEKKVKESKGRFDLWKVLFIGGGMYFFYKKGFFDFTIKYFTDW